jgi:hypothetical protein
MSEDRGNEIQIIEESVGNADNPNDVECGDIEAEIKICEDAKWYT